MEYGVFLQSQGEKKIPVIVRSRCLFVDKGDGSETMFGGRSVQIPQLVNDNDNNGGKMSDNLEGLLLSTLREYFGYQEFRPLQKEIVTAALKGENVLGVLGTGSGKTLTFMLPAVLASKPTLVVSPMKSLIDDTMFRS